MIATFEITVQRCLEFDVFPVVVEFLQKGQTLPVRTEARLTLSAADIEELASQTKATDYGTQLGRALFSGEILRAFDRATAQANGRLHVLLSIEAPELRSLHWEWLCIPAGETFRPIAQDQRFPFCIFQASQVDRHFLPFGRRDLRMLIVDASPNGLEKYNLEPFDEARALETVTKVLGDKVPYEVLSVREDLPGRVGPPTLGQICERLTTRRFTLLHIIAHGRFNREGETLLYLANESGDVHAIPAKEVLARLAQVVTLPHFIFLAVCESAKPEAEAALGGLGQRLVRDLGTPAVLAMTRKVSHFLAYELTKRFYPQLFEHGEVERALVEACAGLVGQTDLSVPALYSRLRGKPLFSDELHGRDMTGAEITFGLDRMMELSVERAPILLPRLLSLTNQIRSALGVPPRELPAHAAALREVPRATPAPTKSDAPRPQGKFRSSARIFSRTLFGDTAADGAAPSSTATTSAAGSAAATAAATATATPARTAGVVAVSPPGTQTPALSKFRGSRGRGATMVTDVASLSSEGKASLQRALAEVDALCLQVIDMPFAAVALDKKVPTYVAQCPFPGMRAFGIDDQRYFFGRDALIQALETRLRRTPFLAVLGASGSGKSSVVRAGLLPRLQRDTPTLQPLIITPGTDPYSALTVALERVRGAEEPGSTRRAIVVVDQFEELFTLCPREKRKPFLDLLVKLPPAIPVILTMRADFWGECAEHAELRRLMQESQELVPPMTGHELRGAIEQQARSVNLRFEANLSDKIIDHIGNEPGAMPLLQHALMKLWERRYGTWLSSAEYDSLGGVQRAIAETADSIYNAADEDDQARMRTVFVRLTRVDDSAPSGESGRDTRQRVPRNDLVPAGMAAEPYLALIQRLTDARLLVTNVNPATQQEEVEVIHDALIRHWPRLLAWLEEQRDSVALREALSKAAREWKRRGQNLQWLVHSGSRLKECVDLVGRFPGLFNRVEVEYLRGCQRQAQRMRWGWGALLCGLLLSVAAVSLLAVKHRREQQRGDTKLLAEQQAKEWVQGRQAGVLATLLAMESGARLRPLSQGLLGVFPFLKHHVTPPGAALSGLRDGLMVSTYVQPLIPAHAGAIQGLALSPEGSVAATVGSDKQLRTFDLGRGTLLHATALADVPNAVAFSGKGDRIVVGDDRGAINLYDRQRGTLLSTLQQAQSAVFVLAVRDELLAAGTSDGEVLVFNLDTDSLQARLAGHQGRVLALVFSASGDQVVSGGQDGTLRFWDLQQKKPKARVVPAHQGAVTSLALLQRGGVIVSGGEDHLVRRWRLDDASPMPGVWTVPSPVSALAVSREDRLAVGDTEGTSTVWQLGVRNPLWRFADDAKGKAVAVVSGLAFSPQGMKLVSASTDGLLRVWNTPQQPVVSSLRDHDGAVTHMEWSPDGRRILTAGTDRHLRVYDVNTQATIHDLQDDDAAAAAASFSPPGEILVLTRKGGVRRYQEESGELLASAALAVPRVAAAFIDRTARRSAIAVGDNVQIWDLIAGTQLRSFPHPQSVNAVSVSKDGKWLATGCSDQRVRVINIDRGVIERTLNISGAAIFALRFSTDGHLLIAGGDGQRPRYWDLTQAAATATEIPAPGSYKQVAVGFSDDGTRAWIAASNGMITQWELRTMQPLLYLRSRHLLLRSAALSPDGKRVLTGGNDGAARMSLIDATEIWQRGCAVLTATARPEDATREEWEQARRACAEQKP